MLSNTLYRFIRTGVVHPYAAYRTFKAYKYKDWPKLEFWLLYWMVMAAYMAVELLADILISWYKCMHFSTMRRSFTLLSSSYLLLSCMI